METVATAPLEALAVTLGILGRLAVPLGLLALLSSGLRRWESHRAG
jgi:hypothetical protein